jgi:chromodomain-helicase-DNA-binding protein 7
VLESEEQVKNFRRELKPYLLRRVKEDVETTIPRLSELIISVEMTNEQKKYYRGLLEKNKKEMVRGLSSANFNSIAMQLRKCCNHPYLIAPEIEQELKQGCQSLEEDHEVFMRSSGKVILLLKLLQKFKKEGKKVLVFSQFVMLLDLIKPFLEAQQFICEILKGNLSSTLRRQAISRFSDEKGKTDVFLISTKAGGVGINLISASEVIIFDSDWNPQNDIQATARAHRIGQKKEVTVYRLVTANSYEAEMFETSSRKLGLDKAIFTGEYFKSGSTNLDDEKLMNKEEIETLLKKGVLGFLENENDNAEYFNQSIEDILEKNARKIEYSTAQSTFSKTTFKA